MDGLEIIAGVVLGQVGAAPVKAALAPFEAVGEHWKERVKARLDATRQIAEKKARIYGRQGVAVSDRVAHKAFTEAAFNDDSLIADYLGGVLAASTDADDDTGAAIVGLIGRLSADQLRLHYLIYRELRRLWPSHANLNLGQQRDAKNAGIRFPGEALVAALGIRALTQTNSLIPPLLHEGLLNDTWSFGPEKVDGVDRVTLRVEPSGYGAALFLWGHGVEPNNPNRIFDPDLELEMLTEVPATPGATLQRPPAPPADHAEEPTA